MYVCLYIYAHTCILGRMSFVAQLIWLTIWLLWLQRSSGFRSNHLLLLQCCFVWSNHMKQQWSNKQWLLLKPELLWSYTYVRTYTHTHTRINSQPCTSLKYMWLLPRNCGIPDPSWSEIRHFVSFLNSQLRDCEQSFFCDMNLMRAILAGPDVLNLEGFRSFVVRFMIQMSRVSVFLLTYKTWLTSQSSLIASIRVSLISF